VLVLSAYGKFTHELHKYFTWKCVKDTASWKAFGSIFIGFMQQDCAVFSNFKVANLERLAQCRHIDIVAPLRTLRTAAFRWATASNRNRGTSPNQGGNPMQLRVNRIAFVAAPSASAGSDLHLPRRTGPPHRLERLDL
jgi:hypothetical protein